MTEPPSDTITREYIEGAGLVCANCNTSLSMIDPKRLEDLHCPACGNDLMEPYSTNQVKIRSMSPLEIKEREEMNRKNTSEAMRARVLAELSKSNGK
jgi:DNA-directed RNA polymerase subunit RPC12/RpoP